MTKITGFSCFSTHKIEYPIIPFALGPDSYDDSMSLPKLPKSYTLDSDSEWEENNKMANVQKQHQGRRMWHILL
jgi:hypothetical protein